MQRRWSILAVTGLAGLWGTGGAAWAVQPSTADQPPAAAGAVEPAGPAVPSPAEEAATPPPPALDPTVPSAQMKAVLGQRLALQAPSAQVKLPPLRIKGRVVSSDGGVSVLLQVGQQLERVSAAAEWTTDDGLTIRALSVSPTELRLQIEPHNRTVTVR